MKCYFTAFIFCLFSQIVFSQSIVYSEDFSDGFGEWSTANWSVDANTVFTGADGNYLHPLSFNNYSTGLNVTTSLNVDLSGQYGLVLFFDLRFNTDDTETGGNDSDGLRLEYTTNGTDWFVLTNQYNAQNWYNNESVEALANGQGWAGDNGNWATATIVLPAAFENNPDVGFRFRFASGTYLIILDPETVDVGIGIDNFIITSYQGLPSGKAPGNVDTGLSLWLRSNGTLIGNASTKEVFAWFDDSGLGSHAAQGFNGNMPVFSSSSINYNPVVNYDDDFMVGLKGFHTREFFIVLDPDFISSSSAETGDVIGYQVGDVGSLELGTSTAQFANEIITHTIDPATSYRASYTDTSGEVVLANPLIINDRLNAGANGQNLFLNGQQVDNFEDVPENHQNFDNQPYIIGYGWDFADDFQGGVAELISYDSRLSASDQANVFTYLAIKYGITLDSDPASAAVNFDYQVNGSTIIWPGTSSVDYQNYHHDVAGIGKNQVQQTLNQIQSQSINDATIVNMSAASDLDDGEYLVWGNDNNPNSFTQNDLISGISQRLQRIWKVKETGDVGTVKLMFDITNLAVDKDNTTLNLIMAPEEASMPEDLADERVSTLVLGGSVTSSGGRDLLIFDNVDFNDGDFFTLGGAVQTIAPGGVSGGLTLWLRPNEGVRTNFSDLVTSWSDVSGSGNDVDQGDNDEKPTLHYKVINGNNALDFSSDFLDGVAGLNTQELFIVAKPDAIIQSTNEIGFLVGFKNGAFDGLYLGDQGDVAGAAIGYAYGAYRSSDNTGPVAGPVTIINARNNNDASGQDLLANDEIVSDTESNAGSFGNRTNSFFRLGNNFLETESYDGLIAEVVSYDTRLSDSEKRDVVSYLALKYGLTLNISTAPYTVSGNSIYDNLAYASNIAGIGVNLDHGLEQFVSLSENDGAIVKMDGSISLESGDYIVWGSDGIDNTLVQATEMPSGFTDERLQTEWKVDVTGNPGSVVVKVYVGGSESFDERPLEPALYSLIINTSNDFSTLTTSHEGAYFSGDTIVFENVDFVDNDYFTIVIPGVPIGAVGEEDATLWLSAEKEVTNIGLDVSLWGNRIGDAGLLSLSDIDGNPPASSTENGFDVITFNGSQYLESSAAVASGDLFGLSDNTTLAVVKATSATLLTFWQTASANRYATGFVGSNAAMSFVNSTGNQATGSTAIVGDGQYHIIAYHTESGVGNNLFIDGGASDGASSSGTLVTGSAKLSIGATSGGSSAFTGKLAELALYSKALSSTDLRDVVSSLAIKYGITLDISTFGYTYNGGVEIYNATGYSSDIVGIGSNSSQGLFKSSSTSINDGLEIAISSPSSLNNEEYLLIGSDDSGLLPTTSELPESILERVTQKWALSEIGDVGTVSLSIDLGGAGYGAYDVTNFSLLLDSDDDFSNGIDAMIAASSFVDNVVLFTELDLSGYTHFGLGTSIDQISDTDADGIPDYFEVAYGSNPNDVNSPVNGGNNDDNVAGVNPNIGINDTGINGDGITDALEKILIDNGASAPISRVTDTDGDGIPDWLEVINGTNPFDSDSPIADGQLDSDGDGIPDALEDYILAQGGTADSSLGTDTDGDGIPDYYEVLMGTNPGDIDSPIVSGADDNDGDGISDGVEQVLVSNGTQDPVDKSNDTDGDGIPDYLEILTDTDPYNSNSPSIPNNVDNVRSLNADYEVVGSNCLNVSGYQWIYVLDNNDKLVYAINPVGNDLGSTCWAVRVLDGVDDVRYQSVEGVQDEYVMNRNWWIKPTNQPSSEVLIRFYALSDEPTDLRQRIIDDGYNGSTLPNFIADSIYITKISGIDELDPFTEGGSRTSLKPVVTDLSGQGYVYTVNINSFSSFVPHYSPMNAGVPLPIELAYFQGKVDYMGVALDWKTYSEDNNAWFFIERAGENGEFTPIMKVAGSGTTNESREYGTIDQNPLIGNNYYRLKQQDYDGEESSSETIRVRVGEEIAKVKLYPNPAQTTTSILFDQSLDKLGAVKLQLIDVEGRVFDLPYHFQEREIKLDVSRFHSGQYFIKIHLNGIETTLPLIVR